MFNETRLAGNNTFDRLINELIDRCSYWDRTDFTSSFLLGCVNFQRCAVFAKAAD